MTSSDATVRLVDIIEETLTHKDEDDFCFRLKCVTQHMYAAVRENPEDVKQLAAMTKHLNKYLMSLNIANPDIYNRLLSFISFRYDILLQQNTTVELADKYLEEVKFILSKKAYLMDSFNIPKLAQCISKVQFVYNIKETGKNLRELYTSFMSDIGQEDVYKDIINELNTFGHIDAYAPAMPWLYYTLYRPDLDELFKQRGTTPSITHPYFPIIFYWKGYKLQQMGMTQEEFFAEGFDNYDFIY